MHHKILKGIALIQFGILLCLGGGEINQTILHSFSDFPFSLAGIAFGIAGLFFVFSSNAE